MKVTFLTNDDKSEMILNTPQTLTEEQKAQARENIGAADASELADKLDIDLPISDASPANVFGVLPKNGGLARFRCTSTSPSGGHIPLYTASKTLRTETPVEDNDAANKAYVDAMIGGGGGGASSEEWITIADITTTEEVNKIWQDAQGFRRIMMYMYLPSELSVKSLYVFYTSDMWSSLYGFSFTGEGRKLLLDFEVIDDLGITLQLNINGNNSSVTNVNNGKLLREGTETELNGVGTALQNNGLFPVGTVIKIRGLKA